MNTLPHAYVTWDESPIALAEFLRYQVYRRLRGAAAWTRIARIPDRSITYYHDYAIGSDDTWEYTVTHVQEVAGDEVESDYASVVSTSLVVRSVFLHDVRAPQYYVELPAEALRTSVETEVRFLQPWGRRAPVAHVGQQQFDVLEVALRDGWEGDGRAAAEALEALMTRQRENGSVFLARSHRGLRHFVVFEGLARDDRQQSLTGVSVRLREVHYREEVDG